ncbi:MAG: D-alanine--D-alanine ligase [Candidatus Dormibacteria bacterium]
MKVAVLSGGISGEREVSLKSGLQVSDALRRRGHEVTVLDFGPGSSEELRKLQPEVVFPVLHGPLGEDGTAAAVLELLGLRYVGSGVLAGALAMNKAAAKRVMIAEGLPTPPFDLVTSVTDPRAQGGDLVARLGLPLAIKPNSAGSSLGFTLARDEDAVLDGVAKALRVAGPDHTAIVERAVPGMEITVGILGIASPRALPVIEIEYSNADYDFEAKYTEGLSHHVIPARLAPAQLARAQELALAAHRLVGARGLSRVDMMVQESGDTWILEVNTLPGMTALSLFPDAARAAGIGFDELVDTLVLEAAR